MGKNSLTKSRLFQGGIFCFVLGVLALIPSAVEFIQIQSYQAGRCTILTKQLLRQTRVPPDFSGSGVVDEVPVFIPDFQFLVQAADGHFYRAQGYALDLSLDANNIVPWNNQSYGQAIVDAYEVGGTYPCWYNSANPAQAVLTQYLNPPFLAQAILFVFVGGIGLLLAMLRWKWRQSRPSVPATGSVTRARL